MREAIRLAYDRMQRVHASLPEEYREGYLENLDFNRRRIVELAGEYL